MIEETCEVIVPRLHAVELTDELSQLLASGANPLMVQALGHQPAAFLLWYRTFREQLRDGFVTASAKEAARQRVAALTSCPFCMHMRARDADGSPLMTDEMATAAQHGDLRFEGFTTSHRLALRFAEQLATDPGGESDELFEQLRAEFGDAGVVELSLAVAQFIGASRVFKFLRLPAPIAHQ